VRHGARATGREFASTGGNALAIAGASLGLARNATAFCRTVHQGVGAHRRWSRTDS
jgi:hypothetical protein